MAFEKLYLPLFATAAIVAGASLVSNKNLNEENAQLRERVATYDAVRDVDLTRDGTLQLPTHDFTLDDALYRAEKVVFANELENADFEKQQALISQYFDGRAKVIKLFYDYPYKGSWDMENGITTGIEGGFEAYDDNGSIYVSNEGIHIQLAEGLQRFGNTITGRPYWFKLPVGYSLVTVKKIETMEEAEPYLEALRQFANKQPEVLVGSNDLSQIRKAVEEIVENK